MIENEEVFGAFVAGMKINFLKSLSHVFGCWRLQSGLHQNCAEGIDVAAKGNSAQQGGFERCGAAAHERVVNEVAGAGQALNEKTRQLGFETGAVGDFVEGICLPLTGGPEFINECGNGLGVAVVSSERSGQLPSFLSEFAEGNEIVGEGIRVALFGNDCGVRS